MSGAILTSRSPLTTESPSRTSTFATMPPCRKPPRLDLVILDELGYLPFSASGGALLLHLISKLCERARVVITTNLSFSEWAR